MYQDFLFEDPNDSSTSHDIFLPEDPSLEELIDFLNSTLNYSQPESTNLFNQNLDITTTSEVHINTNEEEGTQILDVLPNESEQSSSFHKYLISRSTKKALSKNSVDLNNFVLEMRRYLSLLKIESLKNAEKEEIFLFLLNNILSSRWPYLIKQCESFISSYLKKLQKMTGPIGNEKLTSFFHNIMNCRCHDLLIKRKRDIKAHLNNLKRCLTEEKDETLILKNRKKLYSFTVDLLHSQCSELIISCENEILSQFDYLKQNKPKKVKSFLGKILSSQCSELIICCQDDIISELVKLKNETRKKNKANSRENEKKLCLFAEKILSSECHELIDDKECQKIIYQLLETLHKSHKKQKLFLELTHSIISCHAPKFIQKCQRIIHSLCITLSKDESSEGQKQFAVLIEKILACASLKLIEKCQDVIKLRFNRFDNSEEKKAFVDKIIASCSSVLMQNYLEDINDRFQNLQENPPLEEKQASIIIIISSRYSKLIEKYLDLIEKHLTSLNELPNEQRHIFLKKLVHKILGSHCPELITKCKDHICTQLKKIENTNNKNALEEFLKLLLNSCCPELIEYEPCHQAIIKHYEYLKKKANEKNRFREFIKSILRCHCPSLIKALKEDIYVFLTTLEEKSDEWQSFLDRILGSRVTELILQCKTQFMTYHGWLKSDPDLQGSYLNFLSSVLSTHIAVVIEMFKDDIRTYVEILKRDCEKNATKKETYSIFLQKIISSSQDYFIMEFSQHIIAYCKNNEPDIDLLRRIVSLINKKLAEYLLLECLSCYNLHQLNDIEQPLFSKTRKVKIGLMDLFKDLKAKQEASVATEATNITGLEENHSQRTDTAQVTKKRSYSSHGAWLVCLPNPSELDPKIAAQKPFPLNGTRLATLRKNIDKVGVSKTGILQVTKDSANKNPNQIPTFILNIDNFNTYKAWYEEKQKEYIAIQSKKRRIRKKPLLPESFQQKYTKAPVKRRESGTWVECLPKPSDLEVNNANKKVTLPLQGVPFQTLKNNMNKINKEKRFASFFRAKNNHYIIQIHDHEAYTKWYDENYDNLNKRKLDNARSMNKDAQQKGEKRANEKILEEDNRPNKKSKQSESEKNSPNKRKLEPKKKLATSKKKKTNNNIFEKTTKEPTTKLPKSPIILSTARPESQTAKHPTPLPPKLQVPSIEQGKRSNLHGANRNIVFAPPRQDREVDLISSEDTNPNLPVAEKGCVTKFS